MIKTQKTLVTYIEKILCGNIQKQPQEVFCKNGCPYKFHKFHKKTPVLESFFNKVAGVYEGELFSAKYI